MSSFKVSAALGLALCAGTCLASSPCDYDVRGWYDQRPLTINDFDITASPKKPLCLEDFDPASFDHTHAIFLGSTAPYKPTKEEAAKIECAKASMRSMLEGASFGAEMKKITVYGSTKDGTIAMTIGSIDPTDVLRAAARWDDPAQAPLLKDRDLLTMMRASGACFPVRSLPTQYVDLIQSKLGHAPQGDFDAIRFYTENKNGVAALLNMSLYTQSIDAFPATAPFAVKLDQDIASQFPKFEGKVYRGALHAPLELFMLAVKSAYDQATGAPGVFYFPNFVSTSMDIKKCYFTPLKYDNLKKGFSVENYGYQNTLFEINLGAYNARSTIIRPDQSPYDEAECLLSLYNMYAYAGVEKIDSARLGLKEGTPITMVKLNVVDPATAPAPTTREVDESFIYKRGTDFRNKLQSSEEVYRMLNYVTGRYNIYYPPIRLN